MRTVLLTVAPAGSGLLSPPAPEGAVSLIERANDLLVIGPQPVYPWLAVQPPAECDQDLLEALRGPWLDCVKSFAALRFGAPEVSAEFMAEVSSCPRVISQMVFAPSQGALVGQAGLFLDQVATLLR